jgi:hypothetical protein
MAIAAINVAVDPLQIFHAAFGQAYYTTNERLQDAGLIRSQDFDTVFIGTSIGLHVRPSSIDRILGGRAVKLAGAGLSSKEQRFILDAALAAKHPKRVIWQMDDFAFRQAPDVDAADYFPADLYRMNAKGVAGYLLDPAMLRESIGIVARRATKLDRIMTRLTWIGYLQFGEDNLDDLNTIPAYALTQFGRDRALTWFHYFQEHPAKAAIGYDQATIESSFQRDAIDLIQAHPDVTFVIFFPPYSILNYISLRELAPHDFKALFPINTYLVQQLARLPNVKLFDFRSAKNITHDLANFADLVHHSPGIDELLFEYLRDGVFAIDKQNPDKMLNVLREQIDVYRIDELETRPNHHN